jgi:hypothetical protein
MENQNRFPAGVAAHRRLGLLQTGAEKELFHVGCLVEVNGSIDMSAVKLIVESTIDDMIISLFAVMTVEKVIQLKCI